MSSPSPPFHLSGLPVAPLPSSIRHILSLLPPPSATDPPTPPLLPTTHIPLLDVPTQPLFPHLPALLAVIHRHAPNLLIHCSAGISRAPTVACLWEIAVRGAQSAEEAIQRVRTYHPPCDPNPGFRKQLQILAEQRERILNGGDGEGRWFLELQEQPENEPPRNESDEKIVKDDGEALPAAKFKCSACRRALQNQYLLTRHSSRCNVWFMEEPWFNTLNLMEGKIHCEKCAAKIGHWAWKGLRCNCGQYVIPGFAVQNAKVDILR